jgi:hypothetical protein
VAVVALDLGGSRRARVWLQELPDASFDVTGYLKSEPIAAEPPGTGDVSSCAVEVLLPSSPRSHYALLGATFDRNESGLFGATISYGNPEERDLPWSLAAKLGDQLAAGMPIREAKAVTDLLSLSDIGSGQSPPSGQLTVTHAVMAKAGSSPIVFQAVAQCLLSLLSEEANGMAEDKLIRLIRQGLQQGFALGR